MRVRGACFAQFTAIGIVSTFEGVFMKEQGMGETTIGLISGLGTALVTVFGLYWARMADRRTGEVKLIATGFVCGAAGLARRAAPGSPPRSVRRALRRRDRADCSGARKRKPAVAQGDRRGAAIDGRAGG